MRQAQVQAVVVQNAETQPVVTRPAGNCNLAYTFNEWNQDVMYAICMAESGGNPLAVGDNYVINGVFAPSCGLWQIRTLSSRPSCEALKDPNKNLEWAISIWRSQGYNAWSVYPNGSYKRFLP